MSPRSKKEYRETVFLRYKRSSRKEKSRILDEFCATCGYHRKHAIRVLRKFKRLPCSKHLKAIIPLWLPGYADTFGTVPLETIKALRKISS